MLVTIASNSDSDASHFTNHFPEGLIIPKGASIGVVNCSYILREGYTVQTGLNDVFQIKLGNMLDYIDVTIAAGSYENLTLLAAAVQTAIATAIGTQSVFIQACYPVAEQTATGDDEASTVTIHFVFDLASQAPELFVVGQTAFIPNPANVFGGRGGFVNNIVNGAPSLPNDSSVNTSDGAANQNFLVATHKNGTTGSYEGVFRAEYQSAGKESMMLLKTSAAMLPSDCPIQVVFTTNNQVDIFEMIGGVRTQINSGAQAIASGNTVEIRVPEVDPKQTQQIVASYFITAGGAQTEIPVVAPAAGRRAISQYDEFIPAIEFTTDSKIGEVITGAPQADAVKTTTNSNDGTGYEAGDFLTQASTSGGGTGCQVIVTAVDGNGAVQISDFAHTGTGYAGGDTIQFQGGNGANFEMTVATIQPSFAFTAGTGYAAGVTLGVVGGAGTGATFRVDTVAGGNVTALTCIAPGTGYDADDTLALQAGGNNCIITLGETKVEYNRLTNVRATLIASPMNQRPLVLKRIIRVKMGTFNFLFNGNARYEDEDGNLKITSGKIVSNNRAASNIHIQLNDFGPIESREKNSNGKTVAVVPLGDNTNTASGLFNNELFNIVYHKLQNPEPLSNNELSVRMTDFNSNTLPSLRHPVTVTFDIRPDVV